jgi:hypothetical protein
MAKPHSTGRVGRPPGGPGGRRVRDYPQISIRVPKRVRAQVSALTRATGLSQLQLLMRAIECLERQLSKERPRRSGPPE